jgi:hypothetical protein
MMIDRLLLVLLAVAMISAGVASVPQRSPPLEKYLGGRWLVRPVRPDNWVQPYTHEAQFQASLMFDGELSISVRPFFGVDAATGVMAAVAKSVGDTLGPPFYKVLGELLSLVAVATGTPTTVVVSRMATAEEPSTFATWGACSGFGEEAVMSDQLRNVSLDVKLNMESGVNGAMSFAPVATGCNRAAIVDDQSRDSSALQFHVAVHHSPTEFQKYRTITTIKDNAVIATPQCIRIPSHGGEAASEACSDIVLPVAVWSFSAHVIDDSNILLHIVTKSGVCGSSDALSSVHCPVSFALKRTTQSHEDRELWSTAGTLLLLLVVALVKFGPRMYMKWKGISPHSIGANTRSAQYAPAGGKPDLLKHAEILQAAKKRQ